VRLLRLLLRRLLIIISICIIRLSVCLRFLIRLPRRLLIIIIRLSIRIIVCFVYYYCGSSSVHYDYASYWYSVIVHLIISITVL